MRKRGFVPEGRARRAKAERLKSAFRIARATASDMRKRGFEPLRSCERQPLKLVRLPVPPLPRGETLQYSAAGGPCGTTAAAFRAHGRRAPPRRTRPRY